MSVAILTRAAVRTCPPWCTRHITDMDGSVIHEGAAQEIKGLGGLGSITMRPTRYDTPAALGAVTASVDASPFAVDLSAANLLQLAAAARSLAEQMEAGR